MKKISRHASPQQAAVDPAGAWSPPALDPATVDFYLRRGRHERARAFAEMIRGVFSQPAPRRAGEVRELAVGRPAPAPRSEGSRAA